MSDTVVRMRLLILLLLSIFAIVIWLLPYVQGTPKNTTNLQVHFLDVGQGDAIFIETPNGTQVLIDGGRDVSVLRELSKVMGFFDRTIDMVIATHPDSDHVGGLVDVLKRYDVATIMSTENEGDSPASAAFDTARVREDSEYIYARRGQVYDLGDGIVLEVLFPETNPKDLESNTASIVAQLRYKETAFMLTGDSPKSIEEYLVLTYGDQLESDVLKVGHHGSRTSTSLLFLDEVSPTFAVVSAEKNSRYGHPHVEVTDALFNAAVTAFNTADEGTVTFLSDGATVWKQ
jgi:competence protein ComEC